MLTLLSEVARFQRWADAQLPESRSGEWECEYQHWGDLHGAVLQFFEGRPIESWSRQETQAVLYAIARDNEIEYLAGEVVDVSPALLVPLTRCALELGEADARWQLAVQLGRVGRRGGVEEELLLRLLEDDVEYVRRRALGALAQFGSAHVEQAALREWERADPHQEPARIMCLWSLHRVGSPLLSRLLASAEHDPSEHLREYVDRVRRGEI